MFKCVERAIRRIVYEELQCVPPVYPQRVIVELPELEWTPGDGRNWKLFMGTETGKKLLAEMKSVAFNERSKLSPSWNAPEISYQAGRADGLALAAAHIEGMVPPEDGKSEEPGLGPDKTPWFTKEA